MDPDEFNDIQSRLYKLIPKQTQDVVATGIFLVVLPVGFLINIFCIMPLWYPAFGEAWVIRVCCFLVLAFNVYTNWYKMVTVGPSGLNPALPNVYKAGFRYCHSCHTNAPPRAYHCPVCDKCCLRRDHHSSFGAVCVGHFNQRYFVAAVVNLLVLCVPLFSYTWDYTWSRMDGGFSLSRSWHIFLPHIALMARMISLYQFCCIVFCASTFTVLLFVTYLTCAQIFCIWNGQTRMEYLLDIHAYQLGLMDNIRQCLGTRWPLVFISPFIPSHLPSDGMSFVTRDIKGFSDPKNL
ncbi:Palmitoyltransferase [Trichostrongylus colubriformis]|uniref:Palmitoyltransferase n=1 Tax=Trichostrongylus colubriformis TaxID=6319 RepID=A0AAN8FBD6_TRICO